jgi:hypothetical protein
MPPGITSEKSTYRRDPQFRQEGRPKSMDRNIRSTSKCHVLPHTSAVLVVLKFTSKLNYAYEERVFLLNWNSNWECAPPDSLVSKRYPQHHINMFSATTFTIQVGQVLRTAQGLGRMEKYLTEGRVQI